MYSKSMNWGEKTLTAGMYMDYLIMSIGKGGNLPAVC